MPPVGFEPTVSASERPKTYALDRAATETGNYNCCTFRYLSDEATIGVSGIISRHRCRIWSSYAPTEHPERDGECLFRTGKHKSDRSHEAICVVGYKVTPFYSLRDMNT